MRVVCIAAECEPWAKTGGLGDVVDALARAVGATGRPPTRSRRARRRRTAESRACRSRRCGWAPGRSWPSARPSPICPGTWSRPSTSSCPGTAAWPSRTGPRPGRWRCRIHWPRAGPREVTLGRVRRSRLPRPAHRPSARLRPRGLLRRCSRRLRRQRLAVRAAVPRRDRGSAGRRAAGRRAAPPRLAGHAGRGAARLRLPGRSADLAGRGHGHDPQPGLPGLADRDRPRACSSRTNWRRPCRPTPTGCCCFARGSSGPSWSTPSAPATRRRSFGRPSA